MADTNTATGLSLNKAIENAEDILKSLNSSAAPAPKPAPTPAPVQNALTLDPSRHLMENPSDVLMSEEVINKAAMPIVALAGFLAEAVDGIQKAIMDINTKQDAFIRMTAEANVNLTKAFATSQDLFKSLNVPVEQFQTIPLTTEQLNKANEQQQQLNQPTNKIPEAFILQWMEKAVQAGQLSATAVALYEADKTLDKAIMTNIQVDYAKTV